MNARPHLIVAALWLGCGDSGSVTSIGGRSGVDGGESGSTGTGVASDMALVGPIPSTGDARLEGGTGGRGGASGVADAALGPIMAAGGTGSTMTDGGGSVSTQVDASAPIPPIPDAATSMATLFDAATQAPPRPSPDAAAGCLVYPPESRLVSTTVPILPRPGYLQPIEDPVFGTMVTRIGDTTAFARPDLMKGGQSPKPYHHTAKDQPWNSDGTLILFEGYPSAILDGNTYKLLRTIWPPGEHHVWANTNPNLILGINEQQDFVSQNASTGEMTVLHSFKEYESVSFGSYEGNLSNDDRYVALQAKKGTAVTVLVYDITADKVVATMDTAGLTPNHVTMSQSGNFVIVQWNRDGMDRRYGMEVFTRELQFVRRISVRGSTHADYCYDTAGNDVGVMLEDTAEGLQMVRMDSGQKTRLLTDKEYHYMIHLSCRNLKRPGWAYSSQFGKELGYPYDQTVFAVKLDGSGTVQRFAHEHHSTKDEYDRSAFGVPNRDGSRIMWRSDWGDPTGEVFSYVSQMKCP